MSGSNLHKARSDEDTEHLVGELREQFRTLNATSGPQCLTLPGTAYTILCCPREAQYGLGQALGQLDGFFAHELALGRLSHDNGQPPEVVIEEARTRWHRLAGWQIPRSPTTRAPWSCALRQATSRSPSPPPADASEEDPPPAPSPAPPGRPRRPT